ncbi:MAG: phosphatidylglycerol lysyltransferase domain-containing protein [Paracoccaceae bacterium]
MTRKPFAASRAAATTATETLPLGRLAARQALPFAVIVALVWLGWDRLAALDTRAIAAALGAMSPVQWLTGLAFTGLSFWAVGRYDAVVHRLSATGVDPRIAVETGAAAIAVAQTIGMGTLTGALVRWRLLPGLGLAGAMRLSVIVTLSFLAAWAVLAALAVLIVPLPLPLSPRGIALGAGTVLLAAAGLALAALLRPRALPQAALNRLPTLRAMATVLGLTALDTLAAGTVLWVLLPDMPGLGAAQVLVAYLLALGAGLVLTTPGGIGPFEAALLALLPGVDPEPLLAAIIGYRALHYALPAVIGGFILIRGPRPTAGSVAARTAALTPLPTAPHLPFLVDAVIDQAPRAEAALLRHGRLSLVTDRAGRPAAMARATGQSLVMLSDPLNPGTGPDDMLAILTATAREGMRTPVLYKCGARLAAAARARGWRVTPVAREAWLDPRAFTTAGAPVAGLRRSCAKPRPPTSRSPPSTHPARTACRSGRWRRSPPAGPRPMAANAASRWGPGRPTPCLGAGFLAHGPDGRLLGFLTLHATAREQVLDLMRAPTPPTGSCTCC